MSCCILFALLFTFCGCAGSSAINRIEWVDYESSSLNVSDAVVGYLMDNTEIQGEDEELLLNSSGRTEDNLTVPMVEFLLMPVWVYWSASAYLLLISVVGLLMNIVVIVVILNDSQVYKSANFRYYYIK